jgi:prophage regulatory protein
MMQIAKPDVLPLTGKSRWSQIKKFSPVSRETFRKLCIQGRAPQPERMGVRCTYFDNQELHRCVDTGLKLTPHYS